ncbi:hypothetical protein [Mycobacterium sp. ACS4331]|uniref:hypothetical protein n=1 Tax=Mycobacterium sp. ACS4331 TaxID=1834121 RepID=UPI0008024136|nr:hypothetical protein [Mycobacterium sp. ACS4331]OBF16726.1 hypothetical protein A5727_12505 [Mycobacterium sp. ACS4331]
MLRSAFGSALFAAVTVTLGILLAGPASASPTPTCGQHGTVSTECSLTECSDQNSCGQGSAAVLPVPGGVPAIV